jgi:heme/copper-type cytochrome/quinol oxidase subunit 2
MDVTIAMTVGVAMLGMLGLLAVSIVRDLKRLNAQDAQDAYWEQQRRLMARLEAVPFTEDGPVRQC